MSVFDRLRELFASVSTTLRPLTARSVDDLPDRLEAQHVYLIGDPDGDPWSAAMLCPCQCGELIQLSLVKNDRPRWRAQISVTGAVTLHPSVWRTKGCFSHFILRGGRVYWAKRGPPVVSTASRSKRTNIRV